MRTPSRPPSNRWLILVIACLAQFMVVLDATVVNVALPSIQRGLHFSPANLQWVVNAYTLIFGGFLLLGGRAADLLGRKRLFVAGVALFAGASLLNGLAQSSTMLIRRPRAPGPRRRARLARRAVDHHDHLHRDRRAHPGAGRLERDRGRWRRRRSAARRRADRPRLLALGVLRQRPRRRHHDRCSRSGSSPSHGPRPSTARSTSLGATTVTGRPARARLRDRQGAGVRLGLGPHDWPPRRRRRAGGAVHRDRAAGRRPARAAQRSSVSGRWRSADSALLLVGSAMFGMFFFASLYVQEILGYSPLDAGLAFLPVTVGIAAGAGVAQQLISRFGVRDVATAGLAIAAAGMLILTGLSGARQLRQPARRPDPAEHRHGPRVRADHAARHERRQRRRRRARVRAVQHRPAGRRLARTRDPSRRSPPVADHRPAPFVGHACHARIGQGRRLPRGVRCARGDAARGGAAIMVRAAASRERRSRPRPDQLPPSVVAARVRRMAVRWPSAKTADERMPSATDAGCSTPRRDVLRAWTRRRRRRDRRSAPASVVARCSATSRPRRI